MTQSQTSFGSGQEKMGGLGGNGGNHCTIFQILLLLLAMLLKPKGRPNHLRNIHLGTRSREGVAASMAVLEQLFIHGMLTLLDIDLPKLGNSFQQLRICWEEWMTLYSWKGLISTDIGKRLNLITSVTHAQIHRKRMTLEATTYHLRGATSSRCLCTLGTKGWRPHNCLAFSELRRNYAIPWQAPPHPRDF